MIPDCMHMYNCHPYPSLKIYLSCMTCLRRERIWLTWGVSSINHYGNIIPSPSIDFLQYVLWDMAVPQS